MDTEKIEILKDVHHIELFVYVQLDQNFIQILLNNCSHYAINNVYEITV